MGGEVEACTECGGSTADDTALLGPRWREAQSLKRLKVTSVGDLRGWNG